MNTASQSNNVLGDIWGTEWSQKICSQIQSTTSKRFIENIPVKAARSQTRLMQVELNPTKFMLERDNKPKAISIVLRDVTNRVCADNWLATLSDRSAITGLLNNEMLSKFIKNAAERAKEPDNGFGFLYIKIHGFENIKDTYGKMTGNSLLSALGERLVETVNSIHTVFHLHEDGFALLLENINNHKEFNQIENRVRTAINQSYQLRFLTHNASVQAGLAKFVEGTSPEERLNAAKAAVKS